MYNYEEIKPALFTEQGQVMFLAIRDKVQKLTKLAGVVRMQEAIAGNSGSSWDMLACVDRLVELGELRELNYGPCAGQHRVFMARGE